MFRPANEFSQLASASVPVRTPESTTTPGARESVDAVAENSDREEAMNPHKSEQHVATYNSIKRDEAAEARQRARERAAEETLPRKSGPARGAPRAG